MHLLRSATQFPRSLLWFTQGFAVCTAARASINKKKVARLTATPWSLVGGKKRVACDRSELICA